MLDITSQTNVILEGGIKDAKMSSFSSDFQTTLISFEFWIWIINEFGNLNQWHEESFQKVEFDRPGVLLS